jgi:hypothetical protein
VAVILPESSTYEISLSKVLPVLETARQQVLKERWLPPKVDLTFLPMDDRCSNVYSILRAFHAYSTCAHVLLGPSCEYALGECTAILFSFLCFSTADIIDRKSQGDKRL